MAIGSAAFACSLMPLTSKAEESKKHFSGSDVTYQRINEGSKRKLKVQAQVLVKDKGKTVTLDEYEKENGKQHLSYSWFVYNNKGDRFVLNQKYVTSSPQITVDEKSETKVKVKIEKR